MYLGGATCTSKILEHPEAMDIVEDPYVIVIENVDWPSKYEEMSAVMTLMHAKGWQTVNITFEDVQYGNGRMVALFKNPRAKLKNQPNQG
jgi:hypothetical protein